MKGLSWHRPSAIGLDIQPDGIRFIRLKKHQQEFALQQAAYQALPESIFAEGRIKQWDILANSLAELVAKENLKDQPTAIHLPANLVRLKQLELPLGMSYGDIEAEIHADMQRELPGMTESLAIDFESVPQENSNYADIYFAAARKEYVFQYVDCIKGAGLKPVIVDIDICAIKRAVFLSTNTQPSIQAILHVSKNITRFIVFERHKLVCYQLWDNGETADIYCQLRHRIETQLAAFPQIKIQKLFICGCSKEAVMDAFSLAGFETNYQDPFSLLNMNKSMERTFLDDAADFLVALGLALREVPKW